MFHQLFTLVSLLTLFFSTTTLASLLSSPFSKPLIHRDLTPEIANSTATIYAGIHGYTYAGCYNETTGYSNTSVRALSNGIMQSNSTLTPQSCITTCHAANFRYAGLEYGQECWCSYYLASQSNLLNASVCDLACVGNTSQICGGRLALSLYNMTKSDTSAGVRGFGREKSGLLMATLLFTAGSILFATI